MQIVAYVLLVLGGLLCVLNFYLSFLRYPVYRLRGRQSEYRWASGIPLIGSALVVVALLILREPFVVVTIGVLTAAIDTGGLHWFIGTMVYMGVRELFVRRRP